MKKIFNNQKGQAIFEMVLFLPFLVFLYSIYYTIGNSISGSINQQKAVRGYFYHLVKNNSYMSTAKDLYEFENTNSMKTVGFASVGWREKGSADGGSSFAPCFTFSSLLNGNSSETCDGSDREEDQKSRFIRIFTFYGVCGPVYTSTGSGGGMAIEPNAQNNPALCSLSSN